MANGEVSPTKQRLLMWPIVREASLRTWAHRQHLERLIIIPVLLAASLYIADAYWSAGIQDKDIWTIVILSSLTILPHLLIFTFFAVSCHRIILIGEHSTSRYGIRGWSMIETRFFLWMLGIYALGLFFLILTLAAVLLLFLGAGTFVSTETEGYWKFMEHEGFGYSMLALAIVPYAYVVGRLSLVLPAVAIGLRPRDNPSWSLTEQNGWRVTILVGVIPIMFIFFQYLAWIPIEWISGVKDTESVRWHGIYTITTEGWRALIEYLFASVEVAILSLTFKELSGWQPSEAPAGHD